MKAASISFSLVLLAGCAAAPSASLAPLLWTPSSERARVSAMVVDLDTGEVLVAREAHKLCRPASTMKLLTSASICRRALGRAFRTRVVCDGPRRGRVTLVGDGDPHLSTADVRRLAVRLAEQGVTAVEGPLRVVDPLRDAPRWGEGWMWDDEPAVFQPILSGATVDRGCVTVSLRGGERELEVTLQPVQGALEVRLGGLDGALRVTRGRYRHADVVRVSGRLPRGAAAERRLSAPDPARYTGYVLADALRRAGVAVPDDVGVEVLGPREVPAGVEAWCERPLSKVVTETNKVSDNLGAELLLRDLARVSDLHTVELGVESETIGRMTVRADLDELGVDEGGARIADGSGVSHYNLISAELLVTLLVDMHARGGAGFELFRSSLPVAGVDGTLSGRMQGTPAAGRVFAKTGTISGVSNLAGYVDTRSGRRLAFAILCHDFVGSPAPWRALQDRFCSAMAAL
ncbi:MAG: D-alanyl-D-alanine carboxypeptidase/D-alanyl-D-alanine-endopeptidase [Planctomycetota bacterium]|nr:D-alanyl-D-alanine carboxypeptidase/D-alanyl-D-alanine-endopeptidase [Planctomycetota bacterium]MEC9048072.1 D-alanyl-D-alanine carboxypeptidase/D-alanyl-D-alanine-endopeptidase [Planctomycetota bacterium]